MLKTTQTVVVCTDLKDSVQWFSRTTFWVLFPPPASLVLQCFIFSELVSDSVTDSCNPPASASLPTNLRDYLTSKSNLMIALMKPVTKWKVGMNLNTLCFLFTLFYFCFLSIYHLILLPLRCFCSWWIFFWGIKQLPVYLFLGIETKKRKENSSLTGINSFSVKLCESTGMTEKFHKECN